MPDYVVVEHIGDRVQIIKRENRNPYYCYYRDNSGKQKKPSLRTTNLKQARRRAQEIQASLDDDTHSRAEEVRGAKRVTFRHAVDHYLAVAEGTEKTLKETRRRLEYICGDLKDQIRYPRESWGDRRIQSIQTKDVLNWIRKEKRLRTWSDGTEHQYLSAIKQVLKEAVKQNWVIRNQAEEIPKPKITDEKIPEVLDDEVVEPLFDALPDYVMYIMALLLETGLRIGELFNLRWADINTQGDTPSLTVTKSKSGKFRVVPLTDRATRIFDHLRSGSSFSILDSPTRYKNGYAKLSVEQRDQLLADIDNLACACFSSDNRLRGQRHYCTGCKEVVSHYDITYAHAKKLWKTRDKERPMIHWPADDDPDAIVIPRIDIKKSLARSAKDLSIARFHPHQMRHTWATRLLNNGIDHYELMKLGGWSTLAMVERYARVNVVRLAPKVRKALDNLPSGDIRPKKPFLRVAMV